MDALALLDHLGLRPGSTLTQTAAQHTFQLRHTDLARLDCQERENPHSPSWQPMKLFDVEELAEVALRVHGPGLEAATAAIDEGRRQEQAKEARVQEVKADMAVRSCCKGGQLLVNFGGQPQLTMSTRRPAVPWAHAFHAMRLLHPSCWAAEAVCRGGAELRGPHTRGAALQAGGQASNWQRGAYSLAAAAEVL